jgi:hypothetical protein
MKKVAKKDRELFCKMMIDFLNTVGVVNRDNDFNLIQTKHGNLSVSDPVSWNEEGSYCISLMARFKDISNLPSDANQFSGKWNQHIDVDSMGGAENIATYLINRIKDIM